MAFSENRPKHMAVRANLAKKTNTCPVTKSQRGLDCGLLGKYQKSRLLSKVIIYIEIH
jgi:hypothetical protein